MTIGELIDKLDALIDENEELLDADACYLDDNGNLTEINTIEVDDTESELIVNFQS